VLMLTRGKLVPQSFERHTLQYDASGSGQGGEEQAFPAEEGRANAADHLDVVVDGRLEGDEVTGLDLKCFARSEGEIDVIAAGMNEHESGTRQFLEYEAFAAEQPGAKAAHEGDVERHSALREQKAIPLHHDGLARRKIEDLNLAGIMSGEAYFPGASVRLEMSEEKRFAHQFALEGADDFIADGVAGHTRGPLDGGGFVDHLAGFGVDLLGRLQMDTGDLQIVSFDVVFEGRDEDRRGGSRCYRGAAVYAESCRIRHRSAAVRAKGHFSMLAGALPGIVTLRLRLSASSPSYRQN